MQKWRAAKGSPWPASASPASFAADVPANTAVTLLTGTADSNTFPGLAQDYAAGLARWVVDATFVPVPGAEHNPAFASPLVITAATGLATR